MSETTTSAPAAATPAPAPSNSSTNLILLIGIIAICGSILYVGSAPEEEPQPTVTQMTLGDDFWMNLPPEVAQLRDTLAIESAKLAELSDSVADKVAKAESLEDGPELTKLETEIDAVLGEQQVKVRSLQRDFVRRINGLRSTYIVKKMNP